LQPDKCCSILSRKDPQEFLGEVRLVQSREAVAAEAYDATIPRGLGGAHWSGAFRLPPLEKRAAGLTLSLIQLEQMLITRLNRLQGLEAQVSTMAARRRGPGGRRAVRQIELDRQRLGRELHTGVGQLLAAIQLQLDVAAAQLPSPASNVHETLGNIGALAAEALDQVRSVSHRLYAPEWQRLALDAALQQLWSISGVAQRFAGTVRLEPLPREPEPDVKTLFYRAAQEALANIMRHSRASRVDVVLDGANNSVTLTILDNGIGFNTERLFSAPANLQSGIGLRSIREQANGLGGKFLVESGPAGTRLEVSAPLLT
jgi:signal transduction histidine kinase